MLTAASHGTKNALRLVRFTALRDRASAGVKWPRRKEQLPSETDREEARVFVMLSPGSRCCGTGEKLQAQCPAMPGTPRARDLHFRPHLETRGSGSIRLPCSAMASQQADIVRAYRNLYRSGLHAVQYSKPARYVVRDTIRLAFRNGKASDFNARKLQNTTMFLKNAAKDTGIEHKVLRNLLHVRWWQRQTDSRKFVLNNPVEWDHDIRKNGHKSFEQTLEMLNNSLGMCLR